MNISGLTTYAWARSGFSAPWAELPLLKRSRKPAEQATADTRLESRTAADSTQTEIDGIRTPDLRDRSENGVG